MLHKFRSLVQAVVAVVKEKSAAIRLWYDSLDDDRQALTRATAQMITIFLTLIVFFMILAGCCGSSKKNASAAKAFPAASTREVAVADTASVPSLLALRPGQSAMLLEDVVVVARVPYSDNALYVGKVKIGKGTMLVKPKEEK